MPVSDAGIVSVHDVRVGRLERVSEYSDFVFRFEPAWLSDAARPVLGQLFEDRRPDPIVTSGLLSWFAHLLPPRGLTRRLIQRWRGGDPEEDDDFDLLVALGDDLPGAVTVSPGLRSDLGVGGYAPRPRVAELIPAYALPGVQVKISLRKDEEARGLVLPVQGQAGHFIAKLHDPTYPRLPHLEYATTEWARAAGVRCHEAWLEDVETIAHLPEGAPVGDGKFFLAKRFDRIGEARVHAEDFAQLLDVPPASIYEGGSYEKIVRILQFLSPTDVPELIERLAFMVVSGNGDAHLKNWGVVYPDRRHPRLGPAYDLVSTVCQIHDHQPAMAFLGRTRFEDLDLAAFGALAPHAGLTEAEIVARTREVTARTLHAWSVHAAAWPFSNHDRAAIARHWARTPLCASA